MSRVVRTAWLVAVWVALWGRFSVANVASGVVVASLLLVVAPIRGSAPPRYVARPWAVLRLLASFVGGLVLSNVVLTREIVTRRDRIRTAVVEVPLIGVSDGVLTLVANLTALTPGTMTVEVRRSPAAFYVHVLHLEDIDGVRRDIRSLERLAIRAFGSAEAIAALEAAEAVADLTAAADRDGAGEGPGPVAPRVGPGAET